MTNQITCTTCSTTATKYISGTKVQTMFTDGERYYGYPLKGGSIIVNGNSCADCVRGQAGQRNAVPAYSAPIREARVNELP